MTAENGIWSGRRVLVTGGPSLIGSHPADQLLDRGARIRIVDDLTSGRMENIQEPSARIDWYYQVKDRVRVKAILVTC